MEPNSEDTEQQVPEYELLFEKHKNATTRVILVCANTLLFYDDHENRYDFPMFIIDCIYYYAVEWKWFSEQKFIKFQENGRMMRVIDSSNRCERIGTVHVYDIEIDQNGKYLFEFKYIKGTDMDAIIGVIDNRFDWKQVDSLGNMEHCFNWGLRYDGTICFNNLYKQWKTQICERWEHNDTIAMMIDATSQNSVNRCWVNKEEKQNSDLSNFPDIVFPLKLTASAARGGGFEIIRGIKL